MASALPSPVTSAKKSPTAPLYSPPDQCSSRRSSSVRPSHRDCVVDPDEVGPAVTINVGKGDPPQKAIVGPRYPVLVGPKAAAVRSSDGDCVLVDDDGVGPPVSSDVGKKVPRMP